MKNEVAGQVYKTLDYNVFKRIDGNRAINNKNYSKLINSMKEEQLFIPILVNEKYEIIDGQHRFSAARELGLPIYYIVQEGYGINEVKKANMVGSNWTKADFLDMYITNGNEAYIQFNEISKTYGIKISNLIKLFAYVQGLNQKIASKNFEEGTLNINGKEIILEYLEAFKDFAFFECWRTRQFNAAFMKLYFHPAYNHSRMKEKLELRRTALVKKSTIAEYLQLLTKDIYSYQSQKNNLYYDAETERFYN